LGSEIRLSTGTKNRVVGVGSKRAQFNAAEKGDKGMALKILTIAEDMTDA